METQIFSPKPDDPKGIWDVAIIGSGPAGLTAAIYTTRGAASTVIFGGEVWGGQLMLTSMVDNYPGFPEGIMGPELMEKMKSQAVRFGAEFLPKTVTKVDFSKKPFEIFSGEEKWTAKSVIIATGAQTVWLDIPGEAKLIGRGVSSCAPCDAPFFKDKKVAVIGGGDSAMEEASVLSKYASEITIIHRRSEFKASAAMQAKVLKDPKIKVLWDTEVTEFVGEARLEKIKTRNVKTNQSGEILLDGVFVAIGHMPDSGIFKGIVEMDEKGYIKSREGSKTNVEGVFVSGDVHDHTYKQAVTAAGFGCMAALDALNYLSDAR